MLRLRDFLLENKEEILILTEGKTRELAGERASSDELRQGLPIFFQQLVGILLMDRPSAASAREEKSAAGDDGGESAAAKGAGESDESAIAMAAGKPEDAAALHGTEMLRLGYTLSHVVHGYGAMCQSITELAERKHVSIAAAGFRDLNQCLDVAIAGAVTQYQKLHDTDERSREDQHLGFLTHELRNALTTATISFQLLRRGTVGFGGNTAQVLERSFKRMEDLIDRSLTDIRLRVDPKIHVEPAFLRVIVDQILATAEIEARKKHQRIDVRIDPALVVEADQQAFHSALSNLVQNAIKYTRDGGLIQVRGARVGENVEVEVEDECGGLPPDAAKGLFEAFEQRHEDRTGLGLGLAIARRAITLNHGTIALRNLEGRGCVFKIALPRIASPQHHPAGVPGLTSANPAERRAPQDAPAAAGSRPEAL